MGFYVEQAFVQNPPKRWGVVLELPSSSSSTSHTELMIVSSQNVDGLLYDLHVAAGVCPGHTRASSCEFAVLTGYFESLEARAQLRCSRAIYGCYAFVAFVGTAHQSRHCAQ